MSKQVLDRPLRICPSCKKLGYLYAQYKHGHMYLYTVHKNEKPLGFTNSGEPKFRSCYDAGRLYESIDEAEKADIRKTKKENAKKHLSLILMCPECGEKGKLYKYVDRTRIYKRNNIRFMILHKGRKCYLDLKHTECPKCGAVGRINQASKNRLYIRHEKQNGFWGKKIKISKLRRCYLNIEQSKKLEQK